MPAANEEEEAIDIESVTLSRQASIISITSKDDLMQQDLMDQSNMPPTRKRDKFKAKAKKMTKTTWKIVKSRRFGQEVLRTAIAVLVFTTITGMMMIAQMTSDAWFDRYVKNQALSLTKMKTMAAFRDAYATDPLHDRMFEAIPDWSHMRGYLPDAFLTTFMCTFILFNVIWVHRKRIQFQGLVVLRRFLWIMSCLYLFRTMSFIVTTVPNPIHNCVPKYANISNFEQYISLIKDMASGRVSACTDNIYSGHTSLTFVMLFCFFMYSGRLILKLYAVLHAACILSAILITRLHYTVDVLIAMFMSAFVFLVFHFLLTITLDDKLLDMDTAREYSGAKQILANERRALHRVYSKHINRAVWWIDGFDLRLASRTVNPELQEAEMELVDPEQNQEEDKSIDLENVMPPTQTIQ